MIHLRKFNESDNQDYYSEISSNEFDNLINDPEMDSWDFDKMHDFHIGKVASSTWEPFSDNEVNRIKSMVNSIPNIEQMANSEGIKYELGGKIKSRLNILGYDMRTRGQGSISGKPKIIINIHKLKDHWYATYVYFCGYFFSFPHQGKYYKCDQLSGVRKFLKIEIPKVIQDSMVVTKEEITKRGLK